MSTPSNLTTSIRSPALEIVALTPQGDTGMVTTRAMVHNQRGELVLDGGHQYALKILPRAGK
jgi:acyl dehydratase